MAKHGAVRGIRLPAAGAAAALVVADAWALAVDEEALASEWGGAGALGAALLAALTLTWLLMRVRRGAAVRAAGRIACRAGQWRPSAGAKIRAAESQCVARRRHRALLPHQRRWRSP